MLLVNCEGGDNEKSLGGVITMLQSYNAPTIQEKSRLHLTDNEVAISSRLHLPYLLIFFGRCKLMAYLNELTKNQLANQSTLQRKAARSPPMVS